MKVLFFLWKYQILKSAENLSLHTQEFYKLSKKDREKVLDKYFAELRLELDNESFINELESIIENAKKDDLIELIKKHF